MIYESKYVEPPRQHAPYSVVDSTNPPTPFMLTNPIEPYSSSTFNSYVGHQNQKNGGGQRGAGFWDDFGKGFVDGFTMPFKGLNALGIKPSAISELALAGVPGGDIITNGLRLFGGGSKVLCSHCGEVPWKKGDQEQKGAGFFDSIFNGIKNIGSALKKAGIKPSDVAGFAGKLGVPMAEDAAALLKQIGGGQSGECLHCGGGYYVGPKPIDGKLPPFNVDLYVLDTPGFAKPRGGGYPVRDVDQ